MEKLSSAGLDVVALTHTGTQANVFRDKGFVAFEIDFEKEASYEPLIDWLKHNRREIKGIFNCIAKLDVGAILLTDPMQIRKLMDINLIGFHSLLLSLLPYLTENNPCVFLFGSDAGLSFQPWNPVYSITKWALEAYYETLAFETKGWASIVLVELGNTSDEIAKKGMETIHYLKKSFDHRMQTKLSRLLHEKIIPEIAENLKQIEPETLETLVLWIDSLAKTNFSSIQTSNRIFIGTSQEMDSSVLYSIARIIQLNRNALAGNIDEHRLRELFEFLLTAEILD